jgi:hypothetical protein
MSKYNYLRNNPSSSSSDDAEYAKKNQEGLLIGYELSSAVDLALLK